MEPDLFQVAYKVYPEKGNTYSLKIIKDKWAVILVGFNPGGGAEVIAKKENNKWQKVVAGNDLIDCALVESEHIPQVIYGSCINYETGLIYPPMSR